MKTTLGRLISFIAASLILMLLTGCSKETPTPAATEPPTKTAVPTTAPSATATTVPTATPTPVIPNNVVSLPDGSKVILRPGAKIEILKQPGIPAQSQEIVIQILKGEIMAVSNLKQKNWLTIQNAGGAAARFQGCAVVISYDASLDAFDLKCLADKCEITTDAENYTPASFLFSTVLQKGKLLDPVKFDTGELSADYEEDYPECVVKAVPTSTPTATKAPPTATPNKAATATKACELFNQQFPATPCPK